MMDVMKGAGEDLTKWEKADSNEGKALIFIMNIAQAELAVPYLRVAKVTQLLAPLVKQNTYNSLKASARVSYLVGGDE